MQGVYGAVLQGVGLVYSEFWFVLWFMACFTPALTNTPFDVTAQGVLRQFWGVGLMSVVVIGCRM